MVILWGAWVRISHSGDGCGKTWPDCQGRYFLEHSTQEKTRIEWIHRVSSGLFGLTTFFLLLFAFFLKKAPIFKATLVVFFFTITEALIGAGLVLAGLTGSNASFARVSIMSLHLLNSLLLTGSLFICWRLSLGKSFSLKVRFKPGVAQVFILVFFVLALLGVTASLSASLFPSSSLWEGIGEDFNPSSHWLIRFRILHPVLALMFGTFFILCYHFFPEILFTKSTEGKKIFPSCKLFVFCLYLALFSGLMNLLFLSPVFLKLTHLLTVYLMGMSLIQSLEK